MARKQTAAGSSKLSYADSNKLFGRLDLPKLRTLLERVFPERKLVQVSASALKINCLSPSHSDERPSMLVDVRRGAARCMACGYFTRNVLQLFKDACGWSYREALSQIQTHTGVRLTTEKAEAEVEEYDNHLIAMKTLLTCSNLYLLRMLAPPAEGTEDAKYYDAISRHAAQPSLDWWFQQRGHLAAAAPYLPYGLWPPTHVLHQYAQEHLASLANAEYQRYQTTWLTPERCSKIFERLKTVSTVAGPEWTHTIFFLNGHSLTQPGRARLRRPHKDNEKDGNFLPLPGFSEDEPLGFFGLYAPHLSTLTPNEAKALTTFVEEGENDVVSMQERLLEKGYSGALFIASLGNANETDALLDAGLDEVNVISDSTTEGHGNGEVWLRNRLLTASAVTVRVFRGWDALQQASGGGHLKDPDDVIQCGHFDLFKRMVLDERDKWFVPADVWAADRAVEEANLVGVDEVNQRTMIAVSFGEGVRNAAQLAAYVDRVCQVLHLTPSVVRGHIVRGKDDELAFIARTADALLRDFHPLYKEDVARGNILLLHHRATQRTIKFFTDDGEGILGSLSNVVGDIYQYFVDHVGIPTWLLASQNAAPVVQPVREIQKVLSAYLKIAVQTIFQNIPSREECVVYGQGVHFVEDLSSPYNLTAYVVNGPSVFRGAFDPNGAETMTWRRLDGPSEGKYLFLVEPELSCPDIVSVADLEEGNQYTLEEVHLAIKDLEHALAHSWKTLCTTVDAKMLAYCLAVYSCPVLSPNRMFLELVGQHSSGKSTLMSLFCGGQFPQLRVCAWGKGHASYTAASIYQGFNRSLVALCLEEFTRDLVAQTHKTTQVQTINELMRQVIFPGGASVSRATPDGRTRTMNVCTNVVSASIHPAHDPQDASRRFTVETVKVEGHASPEVNVFKLIPPERFRRIRRILALGLMKYYRRYREGFPVIENELSTGKVVTGVDTRFLRNFSGVAPLMEMFGEDWRAFVREATEARRVRLTASARNNIANQLFDTIFRTNNVRVGQGSYTSVAALVASKNNRWMQLNGALCGVYFHNAECKLVIDWIAVNAPGGILNRVEPYVRMPFHLLKHQLDQHPLAKREHEYNVGELTNWLQSFSVFVRPDEITVLDVKDIVEALRDRYEEPTQSVPPGHQASDDGPPGLRRRSGNI